MTTPLPTTQALQELVRRTMDRDPVAYAVERHAAGASWAVIADEIKDRTEVYVTGETVRRWVRRAQAASPPDTPEEAAA